MHQGPGSPRGWGENHVIEEGITVVVLRDRKRRGWIEYETDGKNIWILMMRVRVRYRRRGIATAMLRRIFRKVNKHGGYIVPGTFLDSGEVLFPTFKRLMEEFPDVKVSSDFKSDYEMFCRKQRGVHAA